MIDIEAIRERDVECLAALGQQDTLTRAERDRHLLLDYIDDRLQPGTVVFEELVGGDDQNETDRTMWVVYGRNGDPYALSLHSSAENACRDAARRGEGFVAAWPVSMDFFEAVNTWED